MIHDGGFKPFKQARTVWNLSNEDAEADELFPGRFQNYLPLSLEPSPFLFRPSPPMPHFFSDAVLERGDVKNGVVATHVLSGVLPKTRWDGATREAGRIEHVTVSISGRHQVNPRMLRDGRQVVFRLVSGSRVWAGPLDYDR
jgi:hypothetical protein